MEDFSKRIDRDVREKLTNSWKETKRISDRKKAYYERRRKRQNEREERKKKKSKKESSEDELEDFPSDSSEKGAQFTHPKKPARSFSDLRDEIKFGEVAQQPPNIASKKRKLRQESNDGTETFEGSRAMEIYRNRVMEKYRERKKAKYSIDGEVVDGEI
jgi:hypothetical protein